MDSTSGVQTVDLVAYNAFWIAEMEQYLGPAFKQRTGITAKVINTGGSSFETVDQRVQTDVVGGHVDDIALVGLDAIQRYISAGRAVPLDPLIKAAGFVVSDLETKALALGQQGGITYALPYGVSALVLYYNIDAFKKAGLDPDRPPKTFSELKSNAQTIVSAKAAKYGVTFSNNNSGNWMFQNFLYSNGGRMMNDDLTGIEFNQEPGVQVLQYWAEIFKAGLGQTMTRTEMAEAFARGDLAMMFASSAQAANTARDAKFQVGTAAMPVPDGGQLRQPAGGAAFVILSKDNAKQKLAFQAASTMVGSDACTSMVKASGYSPVNKTAAKDLAGFFDKNPLYKPGNDAVINSIIPWFGFPGNNAGEVTARLDQQMVLALRGSKSPADALNDAAKQAQGLLK